MQTVHEMTRRDMRGNGGEVDSHEDIVCMYEGDGGGRREGGGMDVFFTRAEGGPHFV